MEVLLPQMFFEQQQEPPLLHIGRSLPRWLGHLFRTPPGRLPGEAFRACRTLGGEPPGRTQDTREGPRPSAGLGVLWGPAGGASGGDWGLGSLGHLC